MLARASSLQTRIFVASTLAAALCLGSAIYFISTRLSREGQAELVAAPDDRLGVDRREVSVDREHGRADASLR